MKTILISVIAAIAMPATAQQAPATAVKPVDAAILATVTPTPASIAKAHDLAALLNSDEVTATQFDKMFTKTMPDAMRQVPAYQQLEQQYPGIIMAIVNGSRPIIEADTRKNAPNLIGRLAAIYDSHMTEQEIDKAIEFYRSPTGKWLIMQIATNSDTAAVMQRSIDDPDTDMTPADIRKSTTEAALPSIIAGISNERRAAAQAFMATSAGKKIRALGPQINQSTADWANSLKAESGDAVAQAMLAIAQKYIADHGGPHAAASS